MDKRIIKTKEDLKNGLIELIKTKDLKKISVTDVTTKANINRGTFYLHYVDIYDMVEKIEKEFFDEFSNILEKNKENLDKREYYNPILDVSIFVKQNKELLKTFLSRNGDINFVSRIRNTLLDALENYETQLCKSITDPNLKYYYRNFIVTGGIGVFHEWIKNDCEYSAAKLTKGLINIFKNGVAN